MTPGDLPDEPAARGGERGTRSAPAPGAPVDAGQLRRLKDLARRKRAPRDPIAQEDLPKRSKS